MQQPAGGTAGGRCGTGYGEGVHDLGGGGRIFGVDLIEEGEHIAEESIGVMDRQPGVEAVEGRMVGRWADEGQADIPAHD